MSQMCKVISLDDYRNRNRKKSLQFKSDNLELVSENVQKLIFEALGITLNNEESEQKQQQYDKSFVKNLYKKPTSIGFLSEDIDD